jgi:hypothetical protein
VHQWKKLRFWHGTNDGAGLFLSHVPCQDGANGAPGRIVLP